MFLCVLPYTIPGWLFSEKSIIKMSLKLQLWSRILESGSSFTCLTVWKSKGYFLEMPTLDGSPSWIPRSVSMRYFKDANIEKGCISYQGTDLSKFHKYDNNTGQRIRLCFRKPVLSVHVDSIKGTIFGMGIWQEAKWGGGICQNKETMTIMK